MKNAYIVVRMGDNTGFFSFITFADTALELVGRYDMEGESYHIQQIAKDVPLMGDGSYKLTITPGEYFSGEIITHLMHYDALIGGKI